MRIFLFFLCFPLALCGDFNNDPRLKKIENYFNGIQTLKASFSQINNHSSVLKGDFYIKKPGKMRADYGDTSPLLMISDGFWMTNYDKDLKQASHIPLSSSPAEMMLQETFSFESADVQNIESSQGILKVTFTKRDTMEAGTITFVFTETPLELRKWVAIDPQGNVIDVSLSSLEKNISLKDDLFVAPRNESFSSN